MSKLTKYESLEQLKANAKTNTVSADVLRDRQEKFEGLVYFLRGDYVKGKSLATNKSHSLR